MASPHVPTPPVGSALTEAETRTTKLVAFWKMKEKAPSDTASPPSPSSSSSPSFPFPSSTPPGPLPGPSQSRAMNIPNASPSLGTVQEVHPINAHAQLRTNNNNMTITATITVNPNHTPYSTTPPAHVHRQRTQSEAIPAHTTPINLQNRMRTSQEGDIILTNPHMLGGSSSLPSDLHSRKLTASAGVTGSTDSNSNKNNPPASSSSSQNTRGHLSNSANSIKPSSPSIRSTSLQSVHASPLIAQRRRSLNEKYLFGFELIQRPSKPPPANPNQSDKVQALVNEIKILENHLNYIEEKLKSETLRRADAPYSRELEATLIAEEGMTGETERQILQGLENFKKLHTKYDEVLAEIATKKEALAKLTEQMSSSACAPPDFNRHKRRMSMKPSYSASVPAPGDLSGKPRKTNSFNEALSNIRKDFSRTSIKILSPLTSSKRQSHKHSEPKAELEASAPESVTSDNDGEEVIIETETIVRTDLLKQLIMQKYASPENIRSPFINNLRATWRQKVSKSDSWTNSLQTYDQEEDEEDDTSEGSRASMSLTRKQGSKSQNHIGIPYTDEEFSSRISRGEGDTTSSRYGYTGYKGNGSDTASSSYMDDSDDESSVSLEGRKRQGKYAGKIKSIFVKEKPEHLDQTDVGRLAETLKRRPTYQQLVSKKILRGDAVFGVSLENLIDIPEGIRMMADLLADSGSVDLLDNPGIERDVTLLQNSIDAGNCSMEQMQLYPYAAGTLFLRFLQQLPERLFSQRLSPKFLWVHEVEEFPTLRYTMFRSLIFLLIVPHRNMVAFLFKWLRKMSDDTRKSMYFTSAYLGNTFGHLILHGTDTARAANTTKKLIEDYKHVFLDAEPDIKHFMKDGKQLVKWASVDRLVEKLVDPNCYDEQLAPMLFFCHTYFIESSSLLKMIIGIYLKCTFGGIAIWKSETCKRIMNVLKLWIDSHGQALSSNEPFVAVMAEFMKQRRESQDPDATEKELDRILFQHRTPQFLLHILPPLVNQSVSGNNSSSKGKQLKIPATIIEGTPTQPDTSMLLSASAPSSPRNMNESPPRTLTQTASAHFTRTPPSPLNTTQLSSSSTIVSPKIARAFASKMPSTPIPSSQPQAAPSLSRPKDTRSRPAIPPFQPSSPTPPARGSPSPASSVRQRTASNALTLPNPSPSAASHESPRSAPPTPVFPPYSPPLVPSNSKPTTLSPAPTSRGRSFSRASAPEILIPIPDPDKPPQMDDDRKTFRYTTTYGTLQDPVATEPSPAPSPSPTSLSPLPPLPPLPNSYSIPFSPTSSASPSQPHFSLYSPLSPSLPTLPPLSPTTSPAAPFALSLISSSHQTGNSSHEITDPNLVADAESGNNLSFQIPKSFSIDSHLANAEGQIKRNRTHSVAHGRSASTQLPSSGPNATTELIEIDPKIIAEHMTMIDHENLKAIPMSELLQKNYMKPQTSPNYAKMAQKLNEWGSWTLTEILKHQELYDRANALSLFIEISKENLACNNFNACCAVLGALNNPAIQRLKNTWEKVNKKTMAKFRKMMELFDFTYNSRNYREALKVTKPPAVPYLGLIPKDITSVEEIPTFVENGMCNIDKMRTLYKILCEVQLFQKEQYNFKIYTEFLERLRSLKDLYTDEEAYQRSLKIEPRETNTN